MRTAFGIDDESHTRLLKLAREAPILGDAENAYRATLITALEDGMITADEDAMLTTLRETLGISDTMHATMLAELLDRDD
jgi:tellurite resistance protein